ncbi:MAG: hypothetical protein M3P18_18150 [Actinomycetota bacterium]|nr:hypothetical protein [Actinomycetota bacterium]
MGRTNIVSVDLVEGGGGVAVSLWDEQFPHLRVDLRFEDGDDQLPLDSVCVQRDKIDSMPNPAISTQELRAEFPWTTWERAARAAAANFLISHYADRRPGLSPNGLFEPRSSFDALLLQVVEEYRANVVSGVRNPAAMIAEKHGVKPATARSWLHRARQLGLLGPAADRAAGEVGTPSVLSPESAEMKGTYARCPRCEGQGCFACKGTGLILTGESLRTRQPVSEERERHKRDEAGGVNQ